MSGFNYLFSSNGAWDSSVQYKAQGIMGSASIGLTYISCPVVAYNGTMYYSDNPLVTPNIGIAPSSDSAWKVLGGAPVPTYAFVNGILVPTVASGNIAIDSGSSILSSNVSMNSTTVTFPLVSQAIGLQAFIYVTTAASSGVTLTLMAAGSTSFSTEAVSVGASKTAQLVILRGYIEAAVSNSVIISINASAVTGTVSVVANSSLEVYSN